MFIGRLFQINTFTISTVLLSAFKAPQELRNPASKTVPGKFHGSGGHKKRNFLQDLVCYHISQVSRMANFLIFNIVHDMFVGHGFIMILFDYGQSFALFVELTRYKFDCWSASGYSFY